MSTPPPLFVTQLPGGPWRRSYARKGPFEAASMAFVDQTIDVDIDVPEDYPHIDVGTFYPDGRPKITGWRYLIEEHEGERRVGAIWEPLIIKGSYDLPPTR